jgi:hypothetical protein
MKKKKKINCCQNKQRNKDCQELPALNLYLKFLYLVWTGGP